MNWVLTLLFVAGAAAVGRIYYGIRKGKEKTEKDWDARLIERLLCVCQRARRIAK